MGFNPASRLPPPSKHPQHRYDRTSKFVKTAAFNTFYRAVAMPILARLGHLPRDKAYNVLYQRSLRQIDRLNGTLDYFDGDMAELRLSRATRCPIPGSQKPVDTAWECRNRYVCPWCYGRSVIEDFDYLAPLVRDADPAKHQLFVCRQLIDWPLKLKETAAISNYMTRFIHAAMQYAQRYTPADGSRLPVRDMTDDVLPSVTRFRVWPMVDEISGERTKTACFTMVGLRPRRPADMRLYGKWNMPHRVRRTICAYDPDLFQFADPAINNLVQLLSDAFRYPVAMLTAEARHTAAVLNAIGGKRLRMVRRIGNPKTEISSSCEMDPDISEEQNILDTLPGILDEWEDLDGDPGAAEEDYSWPD